MGTTADKLSYLNGTKKKLRYSLNKIGTDITLDTTFFDYLLLLIDINEKNYYEQIERDSIRGVTTVDGEPSPDNPADVYGITGNYRYDINNMLYTIDLSELELNGINDYYDEIFMGSGYNLFDKDNISLIDGYYVDGTGKIVAGSNNKFNWVKLEPNKTYTLSQPIKSNVTVRPALFSETPSPNITGTVLGTFTDTTPIIQTFTTTDTDIYFGWVYCNTAQLSGHTQQEMLDSIQIEEGPTKNEYEPYNARGKWLLRKDIGKVVLDGSETWALANNDTNTTRLYSAILDMIDGATDTTPSNLICSHFVVQTFNYIYHNDVECISQYGGNNDNFRKRIYLRVDNNIATTAANFQTWLSTHNTTVYYVLATPTTTEITRENYPKLYDSLQKISYLKTFISQYWIDL